MTCKLLVLYYSRSGSVRNMAREIARGIESVSDCEAMLRTVPPVAFINDDQEKQLPKQDDLYVSLQDLEECDGLALGSPTRFGNMAAPMKLFWDGTTKHWFSGTLIGKPACVFTSSATAHSGQESTLLSMMIPLLHHGLLILGVPASEAAVLSTKTGGSFYGASHVAGSDDSSTLSQEEITICRALGKRLAEVASKLKQN